MREVERAADDFSRWGTYRPARYKTITSDGSRTALIACPGCGKVASLSQHIIASDGTVQPSVVCPYNCGFHDMVKLKGWEAVK